ncbi:uncharacterized protein [Amphiura filiformis]|uniref:uncharacterized protein n=1 Tax=Amphiura filiformis TaxID=82378 RepID=UPI003B21FDD5
MRSLNFAVWTLVILFCLAQYSLDHPTMELSQIKYSYSRDCLLKINEEVKQNRNLYYLPNDLFKSICSMGLSQVKPTRRGKKEKKFPPCFSQSKTGLSMFVLNCQSAKTKSTKGIITDLIAEHKIDIFALTETWFLDTESDDFYVNSLTPAGYDIFNVPRGDGDPHGGIAIVYNKNLAIVSKSNNRDSNIKSFESCEIVFSLGTKCFTLVVIYRPPPSSINQLNIGMFFAEFSQVMQDYTIAKGELVFVGDLNLHLDIADDPNTIKFNDLTNSLGFKQFVDQPTHRDGHILDVLISRTMDNLVNNVRVLDMISDHHLYGCNLNILKPPPISETITYRNYRSIDMDAYKEDIAASELETAPLDNTYDLVDKYNNVLSELLDKHAPIKTKKVVLRLRQPWFSDSLHRAKRNRRKAERKWIACRSPEDFLKFKKARNSYNAELYHSKCSFLNDKIIDCGNDFKSMFRTINDILQKKKPTKLPDHDSVTELADRFATYFTTKIQEIRDNLNCDNGETSVTVSSSISCS